MTTRNPAPPLPHPQRPAAAGQALRDAAQAAAYAWARSMGPAGHARAVSQMYSVLRDLGIAVRGLARYQTAGTPPAPASPQFTPYLAASDRWLLDAWQHLDGVLAAEGLGTLPDAGEPGTVLCHAVRNAILAWRQPEGTAADRDTTVEHLITAIWFLAIGALSLAAYAPRRRTIELHAVANSLAEAAACLTQAIQEPADDTKPGHNADPARHQDGRQ
jgi:hypothetical protein